MDRFANNFYIHAQGPALALAHPWLAEWSAATGAPGREDRARVRAPPARRTRPSCEGGTGEPKGGRASPAPDPPGAARQKSEAPPETEPTPTRHDPGRENRIEVPPRAGTTPERPAVLGGEEPGPREGTAAPPDQGRWVGWSQPAGTARAARLEPGDSQPAGVETPAGGRPACRWGRDPPLVARYPGPSTGPRVLKTRAAPPGPPGGGGGGRRSPGPEPLREHPLPAWGGGSRAERLETFLESWRLTPKRGSLTGCRAVTLRGRRTGGGAFLPPLLPRQVGER
ncbi:hypothetical protein NDU88_005637 [Pleurodeles waltl]|uniref:Uncharacterized protein n=1 Tax=Pleurodeles waltl TaxID=8319 RepID=A0AAV7SM90_PLEWA|nr:hypothetical protein NDU88_005637 [Pleurodeles waltl]